MNEEDFWSSLEYRICREINGIKELHPYGLWCDGFLPNTHSLTSSTPFISGTTWMGTGPRKQEEWEFKLLLPHPIQKKSQIPWEDLLPPDDKTKWLSLDIENKHLEVAPGEAQDDEEQHE